MLLFHVDETPNLIGFNFNLAEDEASQLGVRDLLRGFTNQNAQTHDRIAVNVFNTLNGF